MWWADLHPAVPIAGLVSAALAVSALDGGALAVVFGLAAALAWRAASERLFRLWRRLRWLCLMLVLTTLCFVPGEPSAGWPWISQPALATAGVALGRLLTISALAALCLPTERPERIVAGLHACLSAWFGRTIADRAAIRLGLTLALVDTRCPAAPVAYSELSLQPPEGGRRALLLALPLAGALLAVLA